MLSRACIVALALAAAGCFVDEPGDDVGVSESTAGTSTSVGTSTGTTTGATTGATTSKETATKGTDTTAESTTDATTTGGLTCGDGEVNRGEACDDGNLDPGDGCDAECQVEPPALRVFVSVGVFNGAIPGLDAIDAMCTAEAEMYGLTGTYKVWLTTDNTTAPIFRFAPHGRAYVLPGPDAPLVAIGLEGLTSGIHERGITRGPDGVELPGGDGCQPESLVWTGTDNNGTADSDRCNDFTSADIAVMGRAGRYSGKGSGWSSNCSFACNNTLPVYCFEQP